MPTPDAVDRILMREAAPIVASAHRVAVLDDGTGALTMGLVAAAQQMPQTGPAIRIYGDSAAANRRVQAELAGWGADATVAADLPEAVTGADLVVLRLPKTLAALEEIAQTVSHLGDPSVQLLGGARIKHLNRGMNEVLLRWFGLVRASLGQQNSRVLVAAQPTSSPDGAQSLIRTEQHDDLGVTVCATGGVFAGSSIDLGTRLLLSYVDRFPSVGRVLDLGCGNGVLGVVAALRSRQAQVTAVDDSRDAVRSTVATAEANGVRERVGVLHTDRLGGLGSPVEPASVDLVLCNPPFHRGTTRDSSAAYAMFADAAQVLRPGGELWTVFNSHLPYLPVLRQRVGRTTVVGQNPRFTVTRSTRPGASTA